MAQARSAQAINLKGVKQGSAIYSTDQENKDSKIFIISLYYINSSEIPGELSSENMISSQVKITCYLHM